LEELADAKRGILPLHDVSPNVFLTVGLELEEQQWVMFSAFRTSFHCSSAGEFSRLKLFDLRPLIKSMNFKKNGMPFIVGLKIGAVSNLSTCPQSQVFAPLHHPLPRHQ
jgi:hypothetical protein